MLSARTQEPQHAQLLARQRALRRRVIGDRRGLRRTRSDPGPIFLGALSGVTPPRPPIAEDSVPDAATISSTGAMQRTGADSFPAEHALPGSPSVSPTRSARGNVRAGLRHSLDVLCTPPRNHGTQRSMTPRPGSPSALFGVGSPAAPLASPSTPAGGPAASPRLPDGAHSKRGALPEAPSPAPRLASANVGPDVEDCGLPEGGPPAAAHAGGSGSGRQTDAFGVPPPSGRRSTLKPIVFLHGVGFGVFPYLGFVWKLLRAFPGALSSR